ncbi:MAG: UvrB/UvrC motif-containing protein, partial [Candidatus Omnitrophota bacterium]
RLGCGECYNIFRKYLAPLLKRIHGSNQHIGKSPLKAKPTVPRGIKKKIGLQELKDNLQKAIQVEAFEDAARLRDQIKELENKKEKNK